MEVTRPQVVYSRHRVVFADGVTHPRIQEEESWETAGGRRDVGQAHSVPAVINNSVGPRYRRRKIYPPTPKERKTPVNIEMQGGREIRLNICLDAAEIGSYK